MERAASHENEGPTLFVLSRNKHAGPHNVADQVGVYAAEPGDDESKGRPPVLTLDERDHLLRRQGEVCRELEALHSDEFCSGDEAPLILEDGLNREMDGIEDTLIEDRQWTLRGEG